MAVIISTTTTVEWPRKSSPRRVDNTGQTGYHGPNSCVMVGPRMPVVASPAASQQRGEHVDVLRIAYSNGGGRGSRDLGLADLPAGASLPRGRRRPPAGQVPETALDDWLDFY